MKDNVFKQFEGQYSDEKLLLRRHENLLSFIIRKLHIIIVYIVLSTIFFMIFYYIYKSFLLSIIVQIIIFLFMLIYLGIQYRGSWMIITSRRVLKVIKSSLFIEHRRELKLEDIKATLVRKNIYNVLFGFGKIELQGTDKNSNIYFEGIKGNVDIVNYLSRIIDYVKINGHGNEIRRYVDKKDR